MDEVLLDKAINDLAISGYAKGRLRRIGISCLREVKDADPPIYYRPGIGAKVVEEVFRLLDCRWRERDEILLMCAAIEGSLR